MRIENFKSVLRQPAKPTLFRMYINFPGGDNQNTDVFYFRASQIPSVTFGLLELSYMGRKVKHHGDPTYDDWTVQVYNDNDFTIRRKLEKWAERMNGAKDNISYVDPDMWKMSGKVEHLDGEERVIKTYNFVGIYPTTTGDPIDLDWANNDTLEEYSVTFSYDYYETDTTRGGVDAG